MKREREDDNHENQAVRTSVIIEDVLGQRELYARLNCLQGA